MLTWSQESTASRRLGLTVLGLHMAKIQMTRAIVAAGWLLGGVLLAQSATSGSRSDKGIPQAQSSPRETSSSKPTTKSPETALPYRYRQNRVAAKARQYYNVVWGIDTLSVKSVESGEIVRFTYRVLDPDKAKALNEKKNEPSLIDPTAGVKLVVPSLEKVGKLRQSSTPQPGKVYWMAFSNKGGYVKPGHRVDVVIGQFRAEGLVVQ
jgi:hypothetical protein